jgi:peptidoglycan-N-acetylglucosamine deacetylase
LIKKNDKPLAVIHVDVDSLWTIKQDFGQIINRNDCVAYSEAIPRFLEIFEAENVKATFFAIGDDAKRNIAADMIQNIVAKGHEIGNHTMNHCVDFGSISIKEMKKEIIECDSILSQVTNTDLIGFRSPGYYFNESLISTLLQLNYKYDTSSLPTILFPVMNLGLKFLSGFSKTDKKIGRISDIFRGIKPYYLDSNGTKFSSPAQNRILELPITVIPNIRLPFHSTMVFMLGDNLFNLGIKLVKLHNMPLIYLFHAVDLFPDMGMKLKHNHPTLRLSFSSRQQIVKNIVKTIKSNFKVVSTLNLMNVYSN